MTYTHFKTKAAIEQKHKAAQAEAILKDAKENQKLSEEAQDIIERSKDATDKANEKSDKEIEAVKGLDPNQCLDTKLADIGLR